MQQQQQQQQHEDNTDAPHGQHDQQPGAGGHQAQEADASKAGSRLPPRDDTSSHNPVQKLPAAAVDQTIIKHPCLLQGECASALT
jgi:hypothetical protein